MNVVDSESVPQVGQLVKVLRGRDAESYAVIIRIEDQRFVWIADGDKRKFDSPKKKNRLHLQTFDYISTEVRDSMTESGRVTNGKLRFAVNKFKQTIEGQSEKGE
ncbi:KOW domain-containing RNA-binding protein [Caldalkalibacillus salinus]|uniref:KOW domain-containing RNA-binding protein n=1 Tax=Caldalkalibacillus salinus TaxID=2803787 RepID=UPI001923540C|nr:KOW domain-containing RNA-binding protein [Caldalkalibacillus salinus]